MSGRGLVSQMRESGAIPPAPGGRGFIDVLLGLVVVVAIACVSYFGVTTWMSGQTPPPAPAKAQSFAIEMPRWTEADAARCKGLARSAADARLPDSLVFANRSVTEGFAGLATNVQCQLSTKVARMCDPAEKAAMVALVNDYLARADLVRLGLGLQGVPMAVMGSIYGGEMSMGSDIYDMQKNDTLEFMATYHVRVANAVKALARDGLMAPSDFSTFMGGPSETITKMFGKFEVKRNLCMGVRPAA